MNGYEVINNVINKAGEERDFPPALPTTELINRIFTLLEARLIKYTWTPQGANHDEPKERESYIASIIFDGESEQQDAWLGGIWVNQQIGGLIENEALPIVVKLVRDLPGQRGYFLVLPDGLVAEATNAGLAKQTPAALKAEANKSGHPKLDELVSLVRRENKDAAWVCEVGNIPIKKDESAKDALPKWVMSEAKRRKTSEDVVYGSLLEACKMRLDADKEDFPFD